MFEVIANDVVFHFNKKHLEDPTIPMWVLKCRGQSYYVNHVDCSCTWSTKETEKNPHTKGSIKIKNCVLIIDDENNATIRPKTQEDIEKAKPKDKVITTDHDSLVNALEVLEIPHGRILPFVGSCSTTFYITELLDSNLLSMLVLQMKGNIRIMVPNDYYYQEYEKNKNRDIEYYDLDREPEDV